jgi:hypothetical protein
MKNLFISLFCLVCATLSAHDGHEHSASTHLKQWFLPKDHKTIEASFMLFKDDMVFLETAQEQILKYPLSALTLEDQYFVLQRFKQIESINNQLVTQNGNDGMSLYSLLHHNFWLLSLFTFLVVTFVHSHQKKGKLKYATWFLMVGMLGALYSFTPKPAPLTDPNFIDSAFAPFKPKVKTHWDATYFYVEDLGLPSHQMMVGITNWQQQVPTPQCYVGTNAWSIPLNPLIAATPTPTATNFFKGAIALAANGIPIFNAFNNRGEDSYVIGELDKYGGHCGKADDYHYHVAPLSLDSINSDILPIAFALDGFAVYAAKEPTGVTMTALDANHGHFWNGVYHYHGTPTYPYMVGNMVGVVTKDATDQIIPQASARPIRVPGNPLSGATITDHQAVGSNGFNLTYKLNNQNYNINYTWTAAAAYTFNFVSPSGTTTSNYMGQICSFPSRLGDLMEHAFVELYPNPAQNGFALDFGSPVNVNDIQMISITDSQGKLMFQTNKYQSFIEIPNYNSGIYFVKIQFSTTQLVKKLIIE